MIAPGRIDNELQDMIILYPRVLLRTARREGAEHPFHRGTPCAGRLNSGSRTCSSFSKFWFSTDGGAEQSAQPRPLYQPSDGDINA